MITLIFVIDPALDYNIWDKRRLVKKKKTRKKTNYFEN